MMKDSISEALLDAFKRLKTHVEEREKDLDHDIQVRSTPLVLNRFLDIRSIRRPTLQIIFNSW